MATPIFSGYVGNYSSKFRDSPDDHGFQSSWASVPQVAFDSSSYTTRDQVLGTPRRPIWQEAEERFLQEKALKRVAFEKELGLQVDLDRSHYLALSSVAVVWSVVSNIAGAFGTGLGYAGKAIHAVSNGVGKARGFVDSRRIRDSHNPMGRRHRRRGRVQSSDSETESESGNGTQSMLSMPPHMVGATPRVVRQSRRMARSTHAAPPPGFEPTNTIQPIRRGPKTPGKRLRVHFEGDPSTPSGSDSINAPNTPAFIFNTPKDKKMMMSNKDEFQMNINKEKFNTWMKVLHESRWRKTNVKAGLAKLELPTKLINRLYEKRAKDPEPWKALVASHSHNGFLNRSGLVIPKVEVTSQMPRDWEKESELEGKVLSESLMQQKDGKCKICRGFKWAGVVLTREISEGQEVPCYSQHKSVKPYTPQELQEFRSGNHSSLFRRWCQESRWDWLFEDPPLDGLDENGKVWVIPKDDPRLRHVTRLNEVTRFYDADRMDIYEGLKLELSEQDLAAKRFVDAIEKSGNLEVAGKLKQMDMERKRRQVQVQLLCVRQVKLTIKGQENAKTRTGKRPASNADLQAENYKKQRGATAHTAPIDTAPTGTAPTDAAPKPAVRKIANLRKPLGKANANVKSKNTASIFPPTMLEPLQKIPAPFDPVELKKIRLAPPTDNTYKAPETIFRERFEDEMRFAPKQRNLVNTYSAREEDFSPPSKEELEAEIYFENCKKVEFRRIEEEKLRIKELDEEKARAKGGPKDPTNKLPEVGRNVFQFGAKGTGAPASMWG